MSIFSWFSGSIIIFSGSFVIIDEEKYSYENYVMEDIEEVILNSQLSYLKNIRGGIFQINKNEISKEESNKNLVNENNIMAETNEYKAKIKIYKDITI